MMLPAGSTMRLAGSMDRGGGGPARQPFAHVACTTALGQIRLAGKDLLIWQRGLAEAVAVELAALALGGIDDLVLVSAIDGLDGVLAGAMAEAGYPAMPALRRDIFMLARQLAGLLGARDVRIRLEVVETDACRKFHSDYVSLRMITTYLGQGTQWIEAAMRDREDSIRQIGAGEVAIFKGRLWQESPTILHRSPPIGGRNEQRLVLVIDPAPSAEDQAIGP